MKLYDLFNKKTFKIEPGLERIKAACRELGNPQDKLNCILIAGTNGKGSTSAFLESLFRYHGLKTGLFTSPHLVKENERWQINKKPISDGLLGEYIKLLEPYIQKFNLTYFEASTLLTFKHFADSNVDVAILEVGLGGRWDATNVVYPRLSVITNVALDHTHMLGNTLDQIAFEKTGITRENVPVVVGSNQKEILNWLEKRNVKEQYIAERDFLYESLNLQRFNYKFKETAFTQLQSGLIGYHQHTNAATALTAFLVYSEKYDIPFEREKVYEAIKSAKWPGRFDIVSKNPTVILDGAHNPHALETLYETVKAAYPDRGIITVFSGMKDKDLEKNLDIVKKHSREVIITKIPVSRSLTKEDVNGETYIPDLRQALNVAKSKLGSDDILLITGSLYLVGEAKKILD